MLACLSFSPYRTLFVAAWIAACTTFLAAQNPSPAKSISPTKPRAVATYGSLPLSFEANQGQSDPRVRFLSRGSGYSLFLTGEGAVLALGNPGDCSPSHGQNGIQQKPIVRDHPAIDRGSCSDGFEPSQDVVRMNLVGGAIKGHTVKATGEDQLPGKVNYFLGNDPKRWRANLPTYAKVRYSGVYPGVDLIYYGNQRQLEYDFVIAPGANASRIRLQFTAGKQPRIDASGSLVLDGAQGITAFHKPLVYQDETGQRRAISGSFHLMANNTVGFTLGSYDHSRPLIIDPVLVYSTYLGGSGTNGNGDQGNGIAVDSAGSAYIVGSTFSLDFPVTVDAHQSVNYAAAGHSSTAFVSKLNAAGSALVYSTYLGGSGADFGYGIAVDSANNAYVTGATYSTDFPVTCDAFQSANPSTATSTTTATTGFVTKLNSTGNGLAYSTYLGGQGNQASPAHGDVSQAIAVGANGNAYVAGYTWSANFPVTDAAFQPDFHGDASVSNAFVTELNATGTALEYSTYLGGSGSSGAGDYGNALALDAAGDAFVAGSTASSDFPVTSDAYQTILNGSSNAFVAELNPAGTGQVYSTYIGGSGSDGAQAIAVDGSGFAYVAGNTNSSNFPTTSRALEGSGVATLGYFTAWAQVASAAFAAKLSQDGSSLAYSTYLEGVATSVGGIVVDNAGNAYLTGNAITLGEGYFGGFLPTPDALPTPSGAFSAFAVKLDPEAATLSYATLLGGNSTDSGNAVALDSSGNLYVTGAANSTNFPTTVGTFQTANNAADVGVSNAFVSKFALAGENNQTAYSMNTPSYFIPTTLIAGAPTYYGPYCYPGGSSGLDSEGVTIPLTINPAASGPTTPTGDINYTPGGTGGNEAPTIYTVTGYVTDVEDGDGFDLPDNGGSETFYWSAFYTGDSVYAGSSTGGTFTLTFCPPPSSSDSRSAPARADARPKSLENSQASIPASIRNNGPKFTPPSAAIRRGQPTPLTQSPAPACTAPLSPLKVTISPAAVSRVYGRANPVFEYKLSGLLNGDTVTVVPSTPATDTSPVGVYPVTTSVSGKAAANYAITVQGATLTVTKAPLYISARNVAATYGQAPPQPTAYTLTGFVNGDAASVVSGAPALSTTVTSTTPVGFYKIGVQLGTLTAANYYFDTFSNGEGSVGVYKAPLEITVSNLNMTQGGPVPPLTYNLTGFVSGDTQATAVTGAAVLSTTATSASKPGDYPITFSLGTLAAKNYSFAGGRNGVLRVLP